MLKIPVLSLWFAGSILVAVLGFLVTTKWLKPVDMSKHEGFLNATLTIVGTLVSILLGLLVANSIEYYDSVEANATSEATCVSEIFKLATALPDQPKNAIQDSCLRYNKSVLNKEWRWKMVI